MADRCHKLKFGSRTTPSLPHGSGEAYGTYTFLSAAFSCHSLPWPKVFLMSSSSLPALQELLPRLDKSSPGFHDQLCNILYGKEYRKRVPNLQREGLAWLVAYLDEVCHRVAHPSHRLSYSLGSRWSRSFHSYPPEVSTQTQKCMRH